jgi:xanthine/uracil permease/Ca2+-binding EF-hand superfamily protein
VSGLCTALQSSPLGPLSSNLLSIMGTSSAFISVVGITGRAAMPGYGVPLIMGMNVLTFWIEPLIMYALPERAIQALLDPTVKGTVVMVIGLTLTARVGVKLWVGTGGGVDLIIGFICVCLMARISKTKRSVRVGSVKIYLKSISLLLSILIGWTLHSMMQVDSLLIALDEETNATACVQPSAGYGKSGYGYDFTDVNERDLSPGGFSVVGVRCAPGRLAIDGFEFSGPNGDCACPEGKDPPCACACTSPGGEYIVAGCGVPASTSFFDFPGIDPFHPGADGTSVWIPLLLPWFITRIAATLESVGDVTATARYSGKRVDGVHFDQRLRGALNMDALSGLIASMFGSWPLTTMSQNNGLIKMSGLHDWRGGLVAGGLMVVSAPFAAQVNPPMPVMGGCLTVIYASIAMGGISMLTEVSEADKKAFKSGRKTSLTLPVDKPRTVFIVAASVGLGLGAEMHAYGVNSVGGVKHTMGYKLLKDSDDIFFQTLAIIFESGIATATIMALVLSFVWPDTDAALTKREFLKFDKDGSGKIDAAELKIAVRSLGLHISDAELAAMMAAADKDGDGEIDYVEFESMIKNSADGASDWNLVRQTVGGEGAEDVSASISTLKDAFRRFDSDGSGTIDAAELKLAMEHMGLRLSEAELTEMMASADKDGNGEIDIEEFQGMMLATVDGAAAWGKIRSQCATAVMGEAPEGKLAVSTVLACVNVSAWLTQHGLGAGAGQILGSLARSGRGADQWLAELQSMSDRDLEALAGLPSAGEAKQQAYAPPSQPDFEEDL